MTRFYLLCAIQVGFVFSVLLDVPVVRPLFVGLYLTIIPGFLLFKVLRLRRDNFITGSFLSIGLSIFFLIYQ